MRQGQAGDSKPAHAHPLHLRAAGQTRIGMADVVTDMSLPSRIRVGSPEELDEHRVFAIDSISNRVFGVKADFQPRSSPCGYGEFTSSAAPESGR